MKTRLITAIVLIFVLGGLGGAYYYLVPSVIVQTQDVGQVQEVVLGGNKMTGLQIAKIVYGYIESQKRPDGLYNYATGCDEATCDFDFQNPHDISNAWAAYAETGLYKATGNQKYLNEARADGEKILAYCGAGREECVSIVYQIVALYDATGDARYLDLAKAEAEILMDEGSRLYDSGHVMLIGGDAKGMAVLASASGDLSYAQAAAKILEGEVAALENGIPIYVKGEGESARVYKSFACWPQVARIALYEATGNEAYLDAAREFADDMDIPSHVNNLLSATDIQPCIELYQKIGEATLDSKYTEGTDRMTQHMVSEYMDSQIGMVRFYADKTFGTLTDSSYMVAILSKRTSSVYEVN